MQRLIITILAVLFGIIPGFFVVFNSVFTDSSGGIGERLFTFLLVFVSYWLLSFIFSLIAKTRALTLGVSLSAPAIIILILYTIKEPGLIWLSLVYLVLTLVASVLGAFFAESVRRNKKK